MNSLHSFQQTHLISVCRCEHIHLSKALEVHYGFLKRFDCIFLGWSEVINGTNCTNTSLLEGVAIQFVIAQFRLVRWFILCCCWLYYSGQDALALPHYCAENDEQTITITWVIDSLFVTVLQHVGVTYHCSDAQHDIDLITRALLHRRAGRPWCDYSSSSGSDTWHWKRGVVTLLIRMCRAKTTCWNQRQCLLQTSGSLAISVVTWWRLYAGHEMQLSCFFASHTRIWAGYQWECQPQNKKPNACRGRYQNQNTLLRGQWVTASDSYSGLHQFSVSSPLPQVTLKNHYKSTYWTKGKSPLGRSETELPCLTRTTWFDCIEFSRTSIPQSDTNE